MIYHEVHNLRLLRKIMMIFVPALNRGPPSKNLPTNMGVLTPSHIRTPGKGRYRPTFMLDIARSHSFRSAMVRAEKSCPLMQKQVQFTATFSKQLLATDNQISMAIPENLRKRCEKKVNQKSSPKWFWAKKLGFNIPYIWYKICF